MKEFEFQKENDQCVNCKACMDVCPDYAIEIVPEIEAEKNDTHLSFNPLICRTCGQSFINFLMEKKHVISVISGRRMVKSLYVRKRQQSWRFL